MRKALIRELRTNFSIIASKQGLLILMCLVIIMITSNGIDMFKYYMVFFGILGVGYTELESRDKVYISLLSSPCTRKDYVIAKFLSFTIWIIFLFVSGVLLNTLVHWVVPSICEPIDISSAKMMVTYVTLLLAIYYLVYFTLGIKFARICYYVIFMIMIVGTSIINNFFEYNFTPEFLIDIMKIFTTNSILNNGILVALIGLIITLFTCISIFIFEKKDL
ncbi:ABC-2 transporter permease [Clostridium sp.]|uniref:ABC-2 transporter permease n=1 Tax=Clostridium sp. TaxID=1506 RepID=UPI003217DCA8